MIIDLTEQEISWVRQAVQADRLLCIVKAEKQEDPERKAIWNRIVERYNVIDDKLKRYQKLLHK